MARVSVVPGGKARLTRTEHGTCHAYLDGPDDPIHLHLHEIDAGAAMTITAAGVGAGAGAMLYVWSGAITAAGHALPAGSSAAIEAGAVLTVMAIARTRLLIFAGRRGTRPPTDTPRIHLLPDARVPRLPDSGDGQDMGGGLHADAPSAACPLWLHENSFPGQPEAGDRAAGLHAHSEDEVIFVTAGTIRLGARGHGPGTALAVSADTFYTFSAGAEGLRFVNFRAARPGRIRFRSGRTIDEIAYWRERLPRPAPITIASPA